MNKMYINSHEISIYIAPQKINSFSELSYLVPEVSVKKTSSNTSPKLRQAKIGESITVILSTEIGSLRLSSLISGIKDHFLLLNFAPIGSKGDIFSSSDGSFLGVVLPISLNSEFSIGLSISFLFPKHTPASLIFEVPVVQVTSSMSGSGVLLGGGLMVTNAHVVGSSNRCQLRNGRNKGNLLIRGRVLDLALFQTDLDSKSIRKASKFCEGQKIITVGFAVIDGKTPIVTAGYLTKVVYFQGLPLIAMINAKVFNGQSGGGVFTEDLELIGIITANAKSMTEGIYSDLGFCILHQSFSEYPDLNHSLFENDSESLKEIFAFQTTKELPSPRL